jgi:hypothetical protein
VKEKGIWILLPFFFFLVVVLGFWTQGLGLLAKYFTTWATLLAGDLDFKSQFISQL